MTVFAIAGGKGGCGKTTTTLGLAGALAREGENPLVVDADPDMPDVHHRVSVARTPGIDALASGRPLSDVVQSSTDLPGVGILTAGRRGHLDAALRAVEQWEGPVLVDCAAGTSPDAVRPFRHADRSVVVSTDSPDCLADAETTRAVARRFGAPPAGVVLRERDTRSTGTEPPHWQVLARSPTVDRPLSDPRVREALTAVANTVRAIASSPTRRRDTLPLSESKRSKPTPD